MRHAAELCGALIRRGEYIEWRKSTTLPINAALKCITLLPRNRARLHPAPLCFSAPGSRVTQTFHVIDVTQSFHW